MDPIQLQYLPEFYNFIEANIDMNEVLPWDMVHDLQIAKWMLT